MASAPLYAIIIPVHNEEEVLGRMLDELLAALPPEPNVVVAVGLNENSDRSGAIATQRGILVGSTRLQGYGHGCLAAIEAVRAKGHAPDAYVFLAADGACDPADLPRFLHAYEQGHPFVMGIRTTRRGGRMRPWHRNASNLLLGLWASLLGRRRFLDLGPYRLISRCLLEAIDPRELTWGWTIEAQIMAARLGKPIHTFPVSERPRMAGHQKVSGVSPGQTLRIGLAIAAAGWRAARRPVPQT